MLDTALKWFALIWLGLVVLLHTAALLLLLFFSWALAENSGEPIVHEVAGLISLIGEHFSFETVWLVLLFVSPAPAAWLCLRLRQARRPPSGKIPFKRMDEM